MAADHHRIAAVLRPRTFKLSRKIAPAPREPTPDSTCAATPRVSTCVVEAWAKATQVKIDASRLTASVELKQFQEAQNQPSGALGRLLAAKNYPDLKPNQNFLALQSQLEGR